MRKTTFILITTLAALSVGTAAAQPVTLSPEQIGQIFCIARLGNDMAPVEALLTSELTAAIVAADAQNDAIAAANPDEKPPLGDGIPWQAYPDYADQCTPGNVTLMMDEARVAIAYGFQTYPDAAFTDTLHLKLIDGPDGWRVWRIDDIAYATDGDLRTALLSAFMN
jgi:hypothetical protein